MVKRKKSRYRRIRISFSGREIDGIENLLCFCRLVGKVESLPKNMNTSEENPKVYSFVLRLRPHINRNKAENFLLNMSPVTSIMPTR